MRYRQGALVRCSKGSHLASFRAVPSLNLINVATRDHDVVPDLQRRVPNPAVRVTVDFNELSGAIVVHPVTSILLITEFEDLCLQVFNLAGSRLPVASLAVRVSLPVHPLEESPKFALLVRSVQCASRDVVLRLLFAGSLCSGRPSAGPNFAMQRLQIHDVELDRLKSVCVVGATRRAEAVTRSG